MNPMTNRPTRFAQLAYAYATAHNAGPMRRIRQQIAATVDQRRPAPVRTSPAWANLLYRIHKFTQ